jgi:hypothetical protein
VKMLSHHYAKADRVQRDASERVKML